MSKVLYGGIVCVAVILTVNDCTDQGTPPPSPPNITVLVPDSAFVGDTIRVQGANFGATQGQSVVKFGTVSANVYISWSASEIRVKVPIGTTTGSATVTVEGMTSNAASFRVLIPLSAPLITSVSAGANKSGDTLKVFGLRFGTTRGSSVVVFPSAAGTVNGVTYPLWSATEIRVLVPPTAIRGSVYVDIGGVGSNAMNFDGPLSFALDVQPILNFGCAISGCHTGSSPSSGFNQSTYAGLRAGGINYGATVIIDGDSTNSQHMRAMRGTATVGRMPFGGPWVTNGVPDSNIVKIGKWIKQGAANN